MVQGSEGFYICQHKYAMEVLRSFGLEDSNSVCNPIVPGYKMCKDEGGVKVNETYSNKWWGVLCTSPVLDQI